MIRDLKILFLLSFLLTEPLAAQKFPVPEISKKENLTSPRQTGILFPAHGDRLLLAYYPEGGFRYTDADSFFKVTCRNIVLHCVGPFCYLNPRPNALKWKVRGGVTPVEWKENFIGLNTQVTDVAVYDSQFNMLACYPFGVPVFAGPVVMYHNYVSRTPLVMLGDTAVLVLSPTQVIGDTLGIINEKLPAFAMADLSKLKYPLKDTLGVDTVSPFMTGGVYPEKVKNTATAYRLCRFTAAGVNKDQDLFWISYPNETKVNFYRRDGSTAYAIGCKPRNWKKDEPLSKSWQTNWPEYSVYAASWVWGNVLVDESRGVMLRLFHSPVRNGIPANFKPGAGYGPDWMNERDGSRHSWLQVLSFPQGKPLAEVDLKVNGAELLDWDEEGNVVFSARDAEGLGLYQIKLK